MVHLTDPQSGRNVRPHLSLHIFFVEICIHFLQNNTPNEAVNNRKMDTNKHSMTIMYCETDPLQHPHRMQDKLIHCILFGMTLLTLFAVGYKYTLPQSLIDRDICHIMCDRAQFNITMAVLQPQTKSHKRAL
jgi:hypothetical protein